VDFDADGILDILSGSWPGSLFFFKGLGKGKYAKPTTIKDTMGSAILPLHYQDRKTGEIKRSGSATTVWACDLDEDQDLDLLIGESDGGVYFVENVGTLQEAKYENFSVALMAGELDMKACGEDSGVSFVDWNQDGKKDIVVSGNSGLIYYCKNIGNKEKISFAKPELILACRAGSIRAKVHVVDYNGDGKLDILVGDANYPNPSLKKDLGEKELEIAKGLLEELRKFREHFNDLVKERHWTRYDKSHSRKHSQVQKEVGATFNKMKPIKEKLIPYVTEEKQGPNGYVWLYLAK